MKFAVVVLVYFGPLPDSWDLTYESMKRNSEIDWLIMTDQPVVPAGNVRVRTMSLQSLRDHIVDQLNLTVSLERPYKICDFRPAFGEIFASEFRGYRYWGYCDADVVFGDLLPSIKEAADAGFDKIFQRGHLSLVRNDDRMNSLFRSNETVVDWRMVFQSSESRLFDEGGGFYQLLEDSGATVYEPGNLFDIDPRQFRLVASNGASRAYFYMREGKIFETDRSREGQMREGRSIHLQKRPCTEIHVATGPVNGARCTVFGPVGFATVAADDIRAAVRTLERAFPYRLKWQSFWVRRVWKYVLKKGQAILP